MKPLVSLAIASLLSLLLACQQGRAQSREPLGAEQELVVLEYKIADLFSRGDRDALASLIADDFVGFNPLGVEVGKDDVLARMSSPDFELHSLEHQDVRVRVFGDAAVATAITVVKGDYKGEDASGRFRYLRVWIRRDGEWQAVAGQSTPLSQTE